MEEPKISLNKLAEYLDATPSRRRQIVKDQQNPQPFIAARYNDAREEIIGFIEGGMNSEQEMLAAAADLRQNHNGTDFAKQDRNASADAIEDFLDASDQLEINGFAAEGVDRSTGAAMNISGVNVSVRPDVILKDKDTGEVKGAIKFHFSKTSPLSAKSREYSATALRVYLVDEGHQDVDPKKCYVVDVPTQSVSNAPKAFKRKMNDIEAACEEINARWTKIG